MNEADMVAAADLGAYPVVAVTMTEGGDGPFGTVAVSEVARQAVVAWAKAVNGDVSALAAMADLDVDEPGYFLLNPVFKQWIIAPGPVVTQIRIYRVEPFTEPPELSLTWRFTGRQALRGVAAEPRAAPAADRAAEPAPVPWDWTDGEQVFVGNITVALAASGAWRLARGGVSTLDAYLGYRFTSRTETAAEYRRRTGSSSADSVLAPTDVYVLDAYFAEHNERFGSSARLEVSSDSEPAREEAEQLIWPEIWAEVERELGQGDWQPSLDSLTMIRLLGPAPGGDASG
jgi:hypothetical protein